MCHRVTGQSRNSALYQDRHQYEYNLCYKNHVRFHYYRILWFTFTWNKILSDIRKNFTCQGSFKTALWFYNTHIPFLDSNTTLTFNTGTSCRLVWSAERWGNTCFLPQSRVNEFVYDVHRSRSRTGKSGSLSAVAYRRGGVQPPPPPRNSEDIGGVFDRMSKKNRRLDFLL